jgi:hypothetical protein
MKYARRGIQYVNRWTVLAVFVFGALCGVYVHLGQVSLKNHSEVVTPATSASPDPPLATDASSAQSGSPVSTSHTAFSGLEQH